MLTSLGLSNFKSWREVSELRFAPITGLFGANSSGKTSLLQMLLMLKQTVESSDRTLAVDLGNEHSYVELGTLRDVQWKHDDSPLSWHLRWRLEAPLSIPDPDHLGQTLFSEAELGQLAEVVRGRAGRPTVRRMVYDFAEHTFELRRKGSAKGYELTSSPPDGFRLRRTRGRAWGRCQLV